MAISDHPDFRALDPFFRIIEDGVAGLVDGEGYFEMLAEDVVFEYVITVPGYPRRVEGRQAVAALYRPYGGSIVLHRCYDLLVHHDTAAGVIVLEYASEGHVVATGAPYTNRYISMLTITDRAITHWRDYLDPIAVFQALGWPDPAQIELESPSHVTGERGAGTAPAAGIGRRPRRAISR